MIKADMLYQLDLRLRELKQNQVSPFGGVSIFLFGDILQLRPVQSKYIFEEPLSENFKLAYHMEPLWKKFDIVFLITNHRQGEDREYAEILNRIRVGDIQQKDLDKLNERVVSMQDVPKDALIISCKNKTVNLINEQKLSEIEGQEYTVEAVAKTMTQKLIKPNTDHSGAIRNTPLQKVLKF